MSIPMNAARATEVNSDSSRAPRRIATSPSFASALRDGLADLAYSFDGVFRQPGAMSMAERAAYGLQPSVDSHELAAMSPPKHVLLTSKTALPVTRLCAVSKKAEKPADRETTVVSAKRQVSTVNDVRRETKLRACASDFNSRVRQCSVSRYHRARFRATVGSSTVDVIVHAGGRLASVMPWTR